MDERELKLLHDIRQAILLIEDFSKGKKYDDYVKDPYLKSAVERQYEVIGEAINRLTKLNSPIVDQISEYRKIVSFRNIITHAYDEVDDRIVWDIIENKLPVLKVQVLKLTNDIL